MLSVEAIEGLYRSHATRLLHLVRGDAQAPDAVIEDACQHAWTKVLSHRERVEEHAALAWLATTAVHEAWRLARPVEVALPGDDEGGAPAAPATPPELVELRERLGQLRRLPPRQQRLIWLQAAGHSYAELAVHESLTLRTVQRQLLRGKRAVRALDAERGAGAGSEVVGRRGIK